MKTTLVIILVTLMMGVTGVVSADKHMRHQMNADQSMSGMMNMQSMHQYMSDMQSTMDKIHSEKSDKKRLALMDQHMKEMQKGMGMMQGMMMGDMNGKNMPHQGKGSMPNTDDMHNRQNMMEQRMDMMQMMMGQMMDHMMQRQSMGMGN